MPRHVSRVVIIGGGMIGCLTAWRLKQRGVEAVVVERGRIGRQASWAGAGILWPIQPWMYPDAFTRLIEASLALYPALQEELLQRTGISPQWRRCGLLMPLFADDPEELTRAALSWSERFGWHVETLDAHQAREAEPVLAADIRGALAWREVAQVRNPRLLKALRRLLEMEGIAMREGIEVTAMLEDHGRVVGVRLDNGETIAADAVLLAAGSWSGELGKRFGVQLPIKPVKGQIVLLKSKPRRLRHILKHDRAYLVPRLDGRILLGASMEDVGFKRGTTAAAVHALLSALLKMTPALAGEHIERMWMGFRPGTPDGLPILGPVEEHPGLWVASGHYRNGVALAPITAEIMSDWITGKEPLLDMHSFLPGRTFRASPLLGFPAQAPKAAGES